MLFKTRMKSIFIKLKRNNCILRNNYIHLKRVKKVAEISNVFSYLVKLSLAKIYNIQLKNRRIFKITDLIFLFRMALLHVVCIAVTNFFWLKNESKDFS